MARHQTNGLLLLLIGQAVLICCSARKPLQLRAGYFRQSQLRVPLERQLAHVPYPAAIDIKPDLPFEAAETAGTPVEPLLMYGTPLDAKETPEDALNSEAELLEVADSSVESKYSTSSKIKDGERLHRLAKLQQSQSILDRHARLEQIKKGSVDFLNGAGAALPVAQFYYFGPQQHYLSYTTTQPMLW